MSIQLSSAFWDIFEILIFILYVIWNTFSVLFTSSVCLHRQFFKFGEFVRRYGKTVLCENVFDVCHNKSTFLHDFYTALSAVKDF